jgi:hypothetical protein
VSESERAVCVCLCVCVCEVQVGTERGRYGLRVVCHPGIAVLLLWFCPTTTTTLV